jgi:ParB/RepB/Spo0J family partition protein
MSALSPAKPAPSQTMLIPIDAIDVKPQVRTQFDKAALADLAESVRANGILQPLLLRPAKKAGRYELIAGERRLRAAKAAGLTHVPALAGEADDAAKLRMQIAENLDREELDDDEIAKVVRALYDAEGDIGKVAAIVKRSKSWVSKYLAVTMRWHWQVRRILEDGECEDMELLGALNQYAALAGYGGTVSHKQFEDTATAVCAGTIDRAQLRRLVAEAKARGKQKQEAAAAPGKARANAPAKPKRFNPKSVVRDLFSRAHCWMGNEAGGWNEGQISPPDDARTYVDANQVEKIRDVLRVAYDAGVKATAKHGDAYKAVLAKFYTRSYMEGHEHAAWIAGAFCRPLDLAALLEDVMAASKREADDDDDDQDDGNHEGDDE